MVAHRISWRAGVAVLAATGALCMAPPCRAQRVAATVEPEVVVQAPSGPALWRVRKGRSELVILGAVSPTPDGARWDSDAVAKALKGARLLLLSPASAPGFAWAEDFPEWRRHLLAQPAGRTLTAELEPDLSRRFQQAANALGQPPAQYGGYRPAPAGMRLLEDAWRVRRLSGSTVDKTVAALAERARVRVLTVDEGGALPLINAMTVMTPEQHLACVGEALDQVDRLGSAADAGFEAWANGDLGTLRKTYRPPSLCLDTIPGGRSRRERAAVIWLQALEGALRTPGRTVAVADVSELWRPSALLETLRAQGAVVTPPLREPQLEPRGPLVASTAAGATGDGVGAVP